MHGDGRDVAPRNLAVGPHPHPVLFVPIRQREIPAGTTTVGAAKQQGEVCTRCSGGALGNSRAAQVSTHRHMSKKNAASMARLKKNQKSRSSFMKATSYGVRMATMPSSSMDTWSHTFIKSPLRCMSQTRPPAAGTQGK